MNRLSHKVAARWAFRTVMSGWVPPLPKWLEQRRQRTLTAFIDEKDDYAVQTDASVFELARESVDIMLPKFQQLLHAKFHEMYHMNASLSGTHMFYFFAARDAIDTFAIELVVRGKKTMLTIMYVPYGTSLESLDYSKEIEVSEHVEDPELTGMALMRLTRKLFRILGLSGY